MNPPSPSPPPSPRPAPELDAVVVGGGLGGLAAAAELAHRGLAVRVYERHLPGGYASSFRRGRFEFDAALHQLSGVGPPGATALRRFLARVGAERHLRFRRLPWLYRSVMPGVDLRLPAGREAFTETLCRAFPADCAGTRRFVGRVFAVGRALDALSSSPGPRSLPALGTFLLYLPARLGDVLRRDVDDPRARAVLAQYWGYFGEGPAELSFLYFAAALSSYLRWGPAYVEGGSQALAHALVLALEERGGELRAGVEVTGLLVEGGRVVGVEIEGSEAVRARAVLCNADPWSTCTRLLPPGSCPPSYLARLRRLPLGPSTVNLYLGLGRPPGELGLEDHETFFQDDPDLDAHARAARSLGPPRELTLCCYDHAWPGVSPPGASTVSLTALSWGPAWSGLRPGELREARARVAEAMLARAEALWPGLRDAIEEAELATPLTNLRYTANPWGAIYGFSNRRGSHTVLRPGYRGPLPGLWFAGAWSRPGGGMEPAMMSGWQAAARLARSLAGGTA